MPPAIAGGATLAKCRGTTTVAIPQAERLRGQLPSETRAPCRRAEGGRERERESNVPIPMRMRPKTRIQKPDPTLTATAPCSNWTAKAERVHEKGSWSFLASCA